MSKIALKKHMLNNAFEAARLTNSKYVFVRIDAEGTEEIITIPQKSFDKKQTYYNNAYSEELTLTKNPNVKITGFKFGELEELEDLL